MPTLSKVLALPFSTFSRGCARCEALWAIVARRSGRPNQSALVLRGDAMRDVSKPASRARRSSRLPGWGQSDLREKYQPVAVRLSLRVVPRVISGARKTYVGYRSQQLV